jgi:5-methyltetrahydrofolate--homocysteine methyltransferase
MPIIAKGYAGIPKYHEGGIIYDGTPELMTQYATLARDCGATIIGGGCGTTPDYLLAMRAGLETNEPQNPPSLKTIQSILGAFSSESDGTNGNASTRKRRSLRHKIL